LIGQLLLFSNESFGQRVEKQDYIIVGDSALSQGKVVGIPSENNQVIYFARSKRSEPIKYTIGEVTEFRFSERVFVAKNVSVGGAMTTVFLEKLPNEMPEVKLWRLNGKPSFYYLETEKGFEELGEDYRTVLENTFDNPDLKPLLAITNKNEISLNYFTKTASNLKISRTFTKLFTITPWVGYSNQKVGFTIPDSNVPAKISGSSPALGVHGEVFLTHKRNLSAGVGLMWNKVDSQGFFEYTFNQIRFESDIFVDFSLIQIPITVRYYYDLKPNKLRIFAEAGYSYALPSYSKLGVFQAEFERNTVITSTKTFAMPENFGGFIWGIGVEKYLNKHRGIVLGLRNYSLNGSLGESMKGITIQLGYKF
jgi:hypothetical protein